jgi:nucleotide-binding universal stress UspA family protein
VSRIVVPLDESETAEEALPWAAYLARTCGAGLHLLTVWTHDDELWLRAGVEAGATTDRIAAAIDEYLAGVAARVDLAGLQVSTEVRLGKVADQVAEVSQEGDTAMVVITSHGRGGVRRFLQGSVADALVRTLAIPVFVVRPGEATPPIERVLLTLDGSETSEAALEPARALAAAAGARLHLLRVANPLAELPYTALGPAPDLGQLAAELYEASEAYLRGVALNGEAWEVRAGRPLDVILDYAREQSCDVIAMGTHGRGGVIRLALGSTADAVMRAADRPVFLVPGRATQRDEDGG